MPDQTPEPLTVEHLETFAFDPHRAADQEVAAMARELLAARARIAELEAGQPAPDAWVAVKRTHSIHAEGPEWSCDAAVIPATDTAECRHYAAQGFDLVPIAADGVGTRWAAAQPAPVGYAVTAQAGADLWAVLPSAVLPESVAVDRAANYRAEFGRQARVVALLEVPNA